MRVFIASLSVWRFCACAVLFFGCSKPALSIGIQQAFLVQNSGWMEPFYADTGSQLKPLVSAVATAVVAPDDAVYTLAFSQRTPINQSPVLLSQSRGMPDMRAVLARLNVAKKGEGQLLADTDFREAVTGTITGAFKSQPGILWIFTNNKNSPNNDIQTAQRNREFYNMLHLEPAIARALAFPIRMPVKGHLYEANGLMIYALAYGQPAAQALERIVMRVQLTQVLTRPPARLKPLDQDAVRVVPEKVSNATTIKVGLGADKRTLLLDVDAQRLSSKLVLQATLQNLFYPYEIQQANVDARLDASGFSSRVAVEPKTVRNMLSGAQQRVVVTVELPTARVPSAWSLQALAAMGKQVLVPMTMEIRLTGQKLLLSPQFVKELNALFPGDPIADVFNPPEVVKASVARIPMVLRLQYPLLPVLVTMSAVLVLVIGAALIFAGMGRSRRFEISVNGVRRMVMLKGFAQQVLKDDQGKEIAKVRRGLWRPCVIYQADGHQVSFTSY